MQPQQTTLANVSPGRGVNGASELAELRATCRRQALVIDTLGGAISTLRTGEAAVKAENVELRAHNDRISKPDRAASHVEGFAVQLPLDLRAPGAARIVLAQRLRDHVAPGVLAIAQLLISELVTNSVLHSGAVAGDIVIVHVRLARDMLRLEVEDPGDGDAISSRAPDPERGGGFGLNLVKAISERWGFEQVSAGRTRAWAQLRRTDIDVDVASSAQRSGEAARGASQAASNAGPNGRHARNERPAGDRRWTP